MSSEDAVEAFWRELAEFAPLDADESLVVAAALDTLIVQIERRVLAQQPCYSDMECCRANGCSREDHACPTCTARAAQTQETSALPPTDAADAKKSQA